MDKKTKKGRAKRTAGDIRWTFRPTPTVVDLVGKITSKTGAPRTFLINRAITSHLGKTNK